MEHQRLYREDARVLGELGALLASADLPTIEVRLPRQLAEQAIAAWERDHDDGPIEPENDAQRVQRHRAGDLALIGLAIKDSSHEDGDDIVVDLDPVLIGAAVAASDDLAID